MTYAVDFADLKSKVSITQALAFLDITHLVQTGETLRGTCPFCKATNPRGFVVTPSKGTWYCFSEKKGGDVIRLAAVHGRTDDKGAAQTLAAHFIKNGAAKAADNPSAQQEPAPQSKPAGFVPLDYLKTLDASHEALAELDIMPETLIAFQAGYASKGLNRGRLAVAWNNSDGVLIAFIGVSLDGTLPLYLMPKGQPLPYWYGIHRLVEDEPVRILTGVLDVLRATENGCVNVICPLAPTGTDALTTLATVLTAKKLTVEF